MNKKYSLPKLKALLAVSPAYASLTQNKKADILHHLKSKNVSVLQYIYYVLLEEQQISEFARKELTKKLFKISNNIVESTLPLIKKIVREI